jgi:hypothetical protein
MREPRTYEQAVKDELRRDVKIRVGNKTEIMSVMQANIRMLSNAALNGDIRAQLELCALYRQNKSNKSNKDNYDWSLLSDEELRDADRILKKASRLTIDDDQK